MTLDEFNSVPAAQALAWLCGLYERSPWIVDAALQQRPFKSLAQLKRALVEAVRHAGREPQLALLRAHPELAGKAIVAGSLTAESADEQTRSGLTHCTPQELATLQHLNAAYASQITPQDRWAIIVYVLALQRSQNALLEDLPPNERQQLEMRDFKN